MANINTQKKILQSDLGLVIVFTPMIDKSVLQGNLRHHLVCSVFIVNVLEFFNKMARKSQQLEQDVATKYAFIDTKLNNTNFPISHQVQNVDNVENVQKMTENPEFILFYVNYVSPSLNFDFDLSSVSWLRFFNVAPVPFMVKFVPPLLLNLNNSNNTAGVLQLSIFDTQFSNSDINKFVFLFRGLTFPMLQGLFRKHQIAISGGFGGKRLYLNTTNFFLSQFLSHIGYNSTDIYNSYKVSKDYNKIDLNANYSNDEDYYFMLNVLKQINISEMTGLLNSKKELESQILNDNTTLEKTITRFASFISVSEKQKRSNNNKINKMREELQKLSINLRNTESQIVELQNENKKLTDKDISFETVEALYFSRYNEKYTDNFVLDVKNKLKYNRKIKQKSAISTMSNKRSYSTLSRFQNLNIQNNSLNIRNLSLSSLQDNPNIHYKLMLLLNSGDNVEINQKNIENYLISEQNIISSQNLESDNSVLNYKILNSKIKQFLLETEPSINKLLKNSIYNLKSENKKSTNSSNS